MWGWAWEIVHKPSDSTMQGWLSILIMIALGAGFALISIVLSSVLGPKKRGADNTSAWWGFGAV